MANDDEANGNDGNTTELKINWKNNLIVAVVVIVVVLLPSILFPMIVGENWKKNLIGTRLEDKRDIGQCSLITDETDKAMLATKFIEVKNRADGHLKSALFFFDKFYTTILTFSIAGLIAAISLVIVSKGGIDTAPQYLITVFLVSTGMAVFYQGFSGVFQQRPNIDANETLYKNYNNLQEEILTYCATGEIVVGDVKLATVTTSPSNTNSNSNSPAQSSKVLEVAPFTAKMSSKQFINYVSYKMNQYNDIAIGLDETKAPSFKGQFQY
jgi:hypothetical protein